jgi:surfeit locus 1 family protein
MKRTIFNIICISWAAYFAYLGFWQVERMRWKESLIAQVEKYKEVNPVEFKIEGFDIQNDLFKKVFLNGKFLHGNEMILSAKYRNAEREKKDIGAHILTPFLTTEGVVVFINRGWVPEKYKAKESRPESLYEGNIETVIEGIVRENHGKAPWFMPQNNRATNIWFWIDLPEMVAMLQETTKLKNIQPVLIQQTNLTTKNNFQYPEPISSNIEFYNQHLTYVFTWFALSFVILMMLLIYNRKTKKRQLIKLL